MRNKIELVKFLVETYIVNVNEQDRYGETCLFYASMKYFCFIKY
jgi:hypothetical protein